MPEKKAHKWLQIKASEDGKSSTIDINGAIGFDWWTGEGITKQSISAELKEIGALKGDTIFVNINSYGGDVNDGISIHDMLAQNAAKKIVSINGMTASAATIIAMAGDDIKMSDNALFLVHRASTFMGGNINDMKKVEKELEQVDNLMANIYVKKTKKTVDEILAKMNVDNGNGEWLTAQEAKDFGFVTEIFEPTAMAASADPAMMKKFGLPVIPTNKIKQNPDTMKSELRKKFDALFATVSEKLGFKAEWKEEKLKDGTSIKIEMAGTEIAVGDSVADAEGNPTPDKSYTLENDTVIKTDTDSKISEITPAASATEGADDQAPVETEEVKNLKADLKKVQDENAALKADVADVEARMTALGKSITSKGDPNISGQTQFRSRKAETSMEASLADLKAKRKQEIKDRKNPEAKK